MRVRFYFLCHLFRLKRDLFVDMMTTSTMEFMPFSDAELVTQSRAGNHRAFGEIVARYQALLCSLAYSATGSLSGSEDLAQETFLAAWKQLTQLREPEKLRPWLCGIVRNLASDAARRDGREPSHQAESLAEVTESHSPEPMPSERAIDQEEQAILWRAIGRVPEIYRVPLILYYREHQSIETVAQQLEVSADTVKQRLSRGRKMLHDQVLVFVEDALERTSPGQAFTHAVLGALPAASFSAKAASLGAAIKGGAGAKSAGGAVLFGAWLTPLFVLLPNYLGYRLALAGAQSTAQRARLKSFYQKLGLITAGLFLPVGGLVLWFTRHQSDHSWVPGFLAGLLALIYLPVIFFMAWKSAPAERVTLRRLLQEEHDGVFPPPALEYQTRLSFLGLPLLHVRAGDPFAQLKQPVRAWIAMGHIAVGGLFAFGPCAIAPISVGGLSVGLLSFGGVALGGIALGGIAVGVWSMFGGLLVGWQAFDGCFTVGWNAAVGVFALAHGYALGHFASASETNSEAVQDALRSGLFFRCALFIEAHWVWLNSLWAVPFLFLWRLYRAQRKQAARARGTAGLWGLLLATSVVLSTSCHRSGELSKTSKFTLPTGPVVLRQHWAAGDHIVKSFELTATSDIAVPGQPEPIRQTMAFRQEWEIGVLRNNSDGSHSGELKLLKFRMKLEQAGRTMVDYDSDQRPADSETKTKDAAVRAVLANAIGGRVGFALDSSNRVQRLDGVEALRKRLVVDGANDVSAGIRSIFNEGYLRQMIGDSQSLPLQSVEPGDSWPVHGELPMDEMGTITTDYKFELQSWEKHGERLCARLGFAGTLKGSTDSEPAAASGLRISLPDGTASGLSWFDPELGLVIEAQFSQDLKMTIIPTRAAKGGTPPMTLTDQMHQDIVVKLESVKK